MEATNCENIGIKIKIKDNLTDPRILEFIKERN